MMRSPSLGASEGQTGTVALIAGTFPAISETFVRREVEGLSARGWRVIAVSLHDPAEPPVVGRRPDLVVYGAGVRATAAAAAREAVTHPLRTFRTLAASLGDAIRPGDATTPAGRGKLPLQALAGIGLAGRLRRESPGHVHCHFAHSPTSVGMYAARQLGVPFSFVGHANDLFQRRQLLHKKLVRARFVSCISEWHRDLYQQIAPRDADAYPVIRCGVPVDDGESLTDPSARSGSREDFRSEPSAGLEILAVGRLVEKKGFGDLIGALSRLGNDVPDHRLTVIGDGPLRKRLHRQAEELGIAERVRWLGAVDNDRVQSFMRTADLLVLPCLRATDGDVDGIPVVLMEAMASGVAVVSGDLPAIRELVADGRTGVLVPPGNRDRLAESLRCLIINPASRGQLGEAGRRRVIEEFSMRANLDRLETYLRRPSPEANGRMSPS